MSLPRVAAVARHELLLMRRDPVPVVLLLVVPLLFMAFANPLLSEVRGSDGVVGGPRHAVAGFTVMFSLFFSGFVGAAFFREHGWMTWDRLQSSRTSTSEIVIGKVVPVILLCIASSLVLLGVGVAAFDLRAQGDALILALWAPSFAVLVAAFGLLITSLTSTVPQLNTLSNLGSVLLSCVGGALIPLSSMPGWAKAVAPASPIYWTLRALDGWTIAGQTDEALRALGAMWLFTAVLSAVALYYLDASGERSGPW